MHAVHAMDELLNDIQKDVVLLNDIQEDEGLVLLLPILQTLLQSPTSFWI